MRRTLVALLVGTLWASVAVAGPGEEATRALVASLPAAIKPGDDAAAKKAKAMWYLVRDGEANTAAVRLWRPEQGQIVADLFVTGGDGGIFELAAATPKDEDPPVALLVPPKKLVEAPAEALRLVDGRSSTIMLTPPTNRVPGMVSSRVAMLVVSPGAAGKPPRLTAVAGDGTLRELAASDAAKAELLVAPLLEQKAQRDRVLITARELKAIDYAASGLPKDRKVGNSHVFLVRGATSGSVWGRGPYTDDSSLAVAAVHAGLLKDGEWGLVRVKFTEGLPAYEGSEKNGVKTAPWGAYQMSMTLEKVLAD